MRNADAWLLEAAEQNNRRQMLRALEGGANVRATTEDGTTAAMWFAAHNNLEAVLHLIDRDKDCVADVNDEKQTPIIEFAKHGDITAVILLSSFRKDILTFIDADGYNAAMHFARSNQQGETLTVAQLAPECLMQQNSQGVSTPSLMGAWGDFKGIQRMLRINPDIVQLDVISQVLTFSVLGSASLLEMVAKLVLLGFKQPENMVELLEPMSATMADLERTIDQFRQKP